MQAKLAESRKVRFRENHTSCEWKMIVIRLWQRANKRQLSKSFTVVIQPLPTRLIKNNFYILLKQAKACKVFGYGSSITQPDPVGIGLTRSSDTSPDVLIFFPRQRHLVKLFADLRPAVHLNTLLFKTLTVFVANTVGFLHFFHEENNTCEKKRVALPDVFIVWYALWEAFFFLQSLLKFKVVSINKITPSLLSRLLPR